MSLRRAASVCLLSAGVLACASGPASAAEVIVRFKPGVDGAERSEVRREAGASVERVLPLARAQVLDVPSGAAASRALAALERDPRVDYAEPNVRVTLRAWPTNDPFGAEHLWALDNSEQYGGLADADIDALEGWALQATSPAVTVAVVDTGVDLEHPDLVAQLDVVPGSDVVAGDDLPDDPNGHGTHVAGTIGATGGNGVGGIGVSGDVRLLPVRVLDENGSGWLDDIVAGFDLAADAGAAIVNASLGGDGKFPASLRAVIAEHSDVLFVVAAGNDGRDNDVHADWPCNYQPPAGKPDNVVCVAASDTRDAPPEWTNVGKVNVDLAAPGTEILSTWRGDQYGWSDGTSMATPHVSGAAALVLAQSVAAGSPLSAEGLRARLLSTVDSSACWTGLTATGGRLNLGRALGADEDLLGAGPTAVSCPVDAPLQQDEQSPIDDGGDEQPAPQPPAPPPPPAPVTPPPPAGPPGIDDADDERHERTDDRPPRVRISAKRSLRPATLLRRGLRARVRCDEACRLRADVLIGRRTARKLGIKGRRFGRSHVLVGRARATLSRAGTRTITARIDRRARRGLRGARRVRLVLRVVASDPGGNARVRRATMASARR